MKNIFSLIIVLILIVSTNGACNSNASRNEKDSSVGTKSESDSPGSANGKCGNSLMFRKGAEIQTSTYNAQGRETNKQVSRVKKVYQQDGITMSELEIKNTDEDGANEKTMNAVYKCDGKRFYIDLSGFLSDNRKNSKIETSGLFFPLDPSVGETLADVDYSINMTSGTNSRKIVSHIKERKVEAKENITTAAGIFECYRISSIIETETNIPGMDQKNKEIMEKVMKQRGKNIMTFWYAPEVTVIKMEFYMGDKLIMRSEVTGIEK